MQDALIFIGLAWSMLLVLGCVILALRGPTVLDRVLAIDALSLCVVAALTLLAIERKEQGYLDAALALALLGFIGTVVAARYRRDEASE